MTDPIKIRERKYLQLPVDFMESEKGNTLLTNDGQIAAWIKLDDRYHLEITDTPGNSPRFYVSVTESSPENIRQHIVENLEGWYVVRWNLPGDPPVDKNGDVKWP